jgi:hypothetical protein
MREKAAYFLCYWEGEDIACAEGEEGDGEC